MLGIHLGNEVAILHKVDVGGEGDVIDKAVEGLPPALQGDDLLGLVHNFLCEGVLHGITGDQDAVLGVRRPPVKELARHPRLQHPGRGEDDARAAIVEAVNVDTLEVADVLEGERVGHVHLRPDPRVHHVGVRLVHPQGPAGQFGGVPYRDALQMRVGLPVLVEDKEQLLGPAEGEDRDEAPASARHDPLHRPREARLPLGPGGVDLHPVRRFDHENVGLHVGYFRRHEVPIVLHAVISRVQEGPAADLQQEHGRPEDVAGVEGTELERTDRDGLVIVDQLDPVAALHQLLLGVQDVGVVAAVVPASAARALLDGHEAEVVPQQQPDDRLGRVGHEDPAPESGPLGEVGETGGVVQMEVRDEEDVDALRLDPVEEGQAVEAVVAGVDAAVQQDGHAAELQQMARPSDLLARPQGRYGHHILEDHGGWLTGGGWCAATSSLVRFGTARYVCRYAPARG